MQQEADQLLRVLGPMVKELSKPQRTYRNENKDRRVWKVVRDSTS